MRFGRVDMAGRAVVLGVVAAYAAGALIMLSILVATSLWPGAAPTF
ncbi:hypothetical protein [Rhizomicrobium electricum]|nr:hypothetical protein [Rhizomicrobium electricum]NIJ47195.1 hypothetical protein [Rhizomicrobium electricum]